jgi:hypothetical protein
MISEPGAVVAEIARQRNGTPGPVQTSGAGMRLLKADGNFEIPGCYRPGGLAAGSTAAAAAPVLTHCAGVHQDLSQLPADQRYTR